MVSICTISAASASENITDTVTIEDAVSDDAVTIYNEDSGSEIKENTLSSSDENISIATENEIEIPNELDKQDNLPLSAAETEDVLLATGVLANQYSITFNQEYEISSTTGGTIVYYLQPYQMMSINGYNFYISLSSIADYEGNLKEVYKSAEFYSDTDKAAGYRQYTFPAKSVAPGKYVIQAINTYLDSKVLASAVLNVKGNAVISANDYNSYYNSGSTITVKLTDKDTKAPLKYVEVQRVLNGETLYYITDSQGQFTFTPSLNAGTYDVSFSLSPSFKHINTAAVTKKVVINKAPVTVKANKVSGYLGSKVTLKATVTSQGKNVNEGKVTFKINGKEYTANVKNGVATKSVKLSKAKTYTYTATFKGNNFQNAKAVSSSATIKPKIKTKIIVKNQKAYRGQPKAFNVLIKTASGKIVKSGKVKILDTVNVNKKGKAKFYTGGNWNFIKQVGNTVYFKKLVTKTLTVKYIPTSDAYKSCKTKMKITLVYKCTYCGSKTSHTHNGMTFIVRS